MSTHLDYRIRYRRNLPHIQPGNATLFVTFRLAGSLPRHVVDKLKKEDERRMEKVMEMSDPERLEQEMYVEHKRRFGRWDHALDHSEHGPRWLGQPEIAKLVWDSMHFLDGSRYALDTFTLMPNHVHAVFTPLATPDGSYHALPAIMHSLKSYTSGEANKILNRSGQFWFPESFDHSVRDEPELCRIIQYVINNPKKAGLVRDWRDWEWTYVQRSSRPFHVQRSSRQLASGLEDHCTGGLK